MILRGRSRTGALADCLAQRTDRETAAGVCLVMSGGTEGGLSPHWIVFEVIEASDAPVAAALAIGRAHTQDLPSEGLGRLAQVDMVADGVRRAMAEAGIRGHADVHLVQIKCPLLTSERVAAAGGAAPASPPPTR